jgi:steroid 5-alpha reductase family enzyme
VIATFLIGLAIAVALQLALWLVQVRTHDASHVDVGWAYGIGLLAVVYALLGDGSGSHRALQAALVGLWSLRLGTFVLRRLGGKEDRRYAEMRERYGANANRNFLVFFQAQAGFVAAFSLPSLWIAYDGGAFGWIEWLGAAVWAVGVAGEWTADAQLQRWKREHPGVTARGGLWRTSRHPNYFFEWVTWLGVATIAAANGPWGWIAFATPAFLLVLILFVTGIPPSEQQALKSRGDDYRRYQRETSAFVPWFPKTS